MSIKKKNDQGFAILFAVIVTTVVFAVGISLINIITKQLTLSSITKNSKLSYYAALSGKECAEYWRSRQYGNYFGKIGDSGAVVEADDGSSIICNGQIFSFGPVGNSDGPTRDYEVDRFDTVYRTHFKLPLNDGGIKLCADVVVTVNPAECETNRILIQSTGYNVECGKISDTNFGRKVQSFYNDKKECPAEN